MAVPILEISNLNFSSSLVFISTCKMPEFLYSHLGSCIPKYLSTLDKILDNKWLINQSLFEKYQGKKEVFATYSKVLI